MSEMKIPKHVAIILDGNGRWAKRRGLPRKLGHKAGCEALEQIVEDAARLGIKVLSIYAFSTENWKRTQDEVSALMQLFRYYIPRLRKRCFEGDIKVETIGDMSLFDEDLIRGIDELKRDTKHFTRMTFVLGLNYGSRDEIRRAAVKLAEKVKAGELEPEEITEEMISRNLDTAVLEYPDPDLLIRTSGEQRLSNFMLWQNAYAEMYFPELLWPDFKKADLVKAIEVYNGRDRRYGGRNEADNG
ncbi:MAG: di-trans,poly-cis-decaprenylcistransferase [Lachnospiraceae bacterium]|nr:di-trans,poly-cis-decaprenylcistransferase [Lachnospiraceae bacterium]